jgi:hypothetical protein
MYVAVLSVARRTGTRSSQCGFLRSTCSCLHQFSVVLYRGW